ncbi:three-helix bundle dimerization domain-containing protein [Citricoccus sp. I39-566]|uniref:three-helix bundle dimerization domain-containing protein n=1 Tax=Citricoccus sp. I39-566 TaxID=3073268 RepID=UPI00286C5992|nr:hypothetical protein [Citricoccus sp. I39-566]WMY78649.1 hypothetical protein RE421_01935 [Citricoccus sp. I39-566]
MTTHVMTEYSRSTADQARPAGRHAAPAPAGNGLDGSLPTGPNHILHARVLARATQRLQTKYAALEQEVVRSAVSAAYRELDRTARLKTYLPTLAVHRAENTLRGLAAGVAEGVTHREGLTEAVPAAA